MKILVSDITESPKNLKFAESIDELNHIYKKTDARDFYFPSVVEVDLDYYRSGSNLFFAGVFDGTIEGSCARCLKRYPFSVQRRFRFVLTSENLLARKGELNQDELTVSFFRADEVELFPFVREQVLLALPTRPLCDENCRGLCPGCGANLNDEPCHCLRASSSLRLTPARTLNGRPD
jgi:uncharacterized protein